MNEKNPIIRRNLSHLVAERLLLMIRMGSLKPGDMFPSERQQMALFGVGRPSIREAMQCLCNWGLAATTHGQLSQVSELTPAAIFSATKQAMEAVILHDGVSRTAAILELEQLFMAIENIKVGGSSYQKHSILIPLCEMLTAIVSDDQRVSQT